MKRFKEKIKAIWHIIIDKEYIVFTVTIHNGKRKSASALISDNASNIFIKTAIEVLKKDMKLIDDINAWASRTFPYQTSLSKTFHLQDEAKELEMAIKSRDTENIKEELADIFILLISTAHLENVDFPELLECSRRKLEINKKRKWGVPDERGISRHK